MTWQKPQLSGETHLNSHLQMNSFIDCHVRELRKRGFRVYTSLSNEEDERAILNGEFTFVFCNPESIIRNAKWR